MAFVPDEKFELISRARAFVAVVLVTVGLWAAPSEASGSAAPRSAARADVHCSTWFSGLLEPTKKLQDARAKLAAQIEANLANPPTVPIRRFAPEEIKIVPMRSGQPFDFEYSDDLGVVAYWSPEKSIGKELRFKKSDGSVHTLEIIGSSLDPAGLDRMTNLVASMPADVLEVTSRIELQGFVRKTGVLGYAQRSGFVVHEDGLTAKTAIHEFGHNLASGLWGRAQPYREWHEAFKKDGQRFVSKYASDSFGSSGARAEEARSALTGTRFAEDFADGVTLYLQNNAYFRTQFPNRAALLDTVFRGGGKTMDESPLAPGGVWYPIRNYYNKPVSVAARAIEERPGFYSTFVVAVAGGAGLVRIIYDETQAPKPSTAPSPTSKPTPLPTPSATPN